MSDTITEAVEDNKIEQRDSVKLTKNRNGYTYEFRLLRQKDETLTEFISRVSGFNSMLLQEYGSAE